MSVLSDLGPAARVPLFLPCAAGVEPLLADECAAILCIDLSVIPADPRQRRVLPLRGGVQVRGDVADAMRLNLESRLAQRVLWPLADGPYGHEDDLYGLARRVPWADWIAPNQTFRIDTSAIRSPLKSLNFATLRVKDALCDSLRDATGARPSVDTRQPHLSVVLHLTEDWAVLSVDTSGEALFKRGWRDEHAAGGSGVRGGGASRAKGEAPLKETLAAAMLAAAGWRGRPEDGPLLDPCCGAGTIAIEAAQIACGIAPGLKRRFAFERLAPFLPQRALWQQIKAEAQARIHAPAVAVHAGDVSFRLTDFAQRNAERAGVAHAIRFKTADALQRPAPEDGPGVVVMNPPYGERIAPKGSGGAAGRGPGAAPGGRVVASREGFGAVAGEAEAAPGAQGADASAEAALAFHRGLSAQWKRHYAGWTAWVLSPDAKLPQALRLKEGRRVPMWNGPIECRLFRFDLVAGSARARPAHAADEPAAPA